MADSTKSPGVGDVSPQAANEASSDVPAESTSHRLKRYGIYVAVAAIAVLVAAAVVPRWWSHRIGDVVDGSITAGSVVGVLVGAVCSFVPIFIVARGVVRRTSHVVAFIGVAAIVAFPNLATFWVAAGTGGGARVGRETMDVEAPGFRGGTLVGVLLGVAAVAALEYTLWSRRSAKRKLAEANQAAVDQAEATQAAASTSTEAPPPTAPEETGGGKP